MSVNAGTEFVPQLFVALQHSVELATTFFNDMP
jgi:hypothetical protein